METNWGLDGWLSYAHEIDRRRPSAQRDAAVVKHLATSALRNATEDALRVELVVLLGLDRYGWGLARLILDGGDVADMMIQAGLARPYSGGRSVSWCE